MRDTYFPIWTTSTIYRISLHHPFSIVFIAILAILRFFYVVVCLWVFYPVSLTFFSLRVLTPFSHAYYGFVMFDTWQVEFPHLAVVVHLPLLFLLHFHSPPPPLSLSSYCIHGPLLYHINFRIGFSSFTEKYYWDFSWNCIELTSYLYMVPSSHLWT